MTTFIRKRKTGCAAVDAWKLHYVQLEHLFDEVDGFEEFMLVLANNILRDSIFGMLGRVLLGAGLSTTNFVTDIYVIEKYYKEGFDTQANAMVGMLATNMVFQLLIVLAQNQKKSWKAKAIEILITLLFLRPAVDAYRVSTNYKDEEATFEPLVELIINKVRDCYEEIEVEHPSSLTARPLVHFLFRRVSSLGRRRFLGACCKSSSF